MPIFYFSQTARARAFIKLVYLYPKEGVYLYPKEGRKEIAQAVPKPAEGDPNLYRRAVAYAVLKNAAFQ